MLETTIRNAPSPLLLLAIAVCLVAYGHADAYARSRGLRFLGPRETRHANGDRGIVWCVAWVPVMRYEESHSTLA